MKKYMVVNIDRERGRIMLDKKWFDVKEPALKILPKLQIGAEVYEKNLTLDSDGAIKFIRTEPIRHLAPATHESSVAVSTSDDSKPNNNYDTMLMSYVKDIMVACIDKGILPQFETVVAKWYSKSIDVIKEYKKK